MQFRTLRIWLLETIRTAVGELNRNWRRAILTSIGMVVGTASLILVVTVGTSGRAYIMDEIRGIGSNLVYAYMQKAESAGRPISLSDYLSLDDARAIGRLPAVQAVAPIIMDYDNLTLNGVTRQITVIGTTPPYRMVRDLVLLSGRFIDDTDEAARSKVCVVTPLLAEQLEQDPFYTGDLQLFGLQFTQIGVFRERVNTYGQTEVSDYSALIPATVMRYFKKSDAVDQIYASAVSLSEVPEATVEVRRLIESRHENKIIYRVENMTGILDAANKISLVLSLVLLAIALISLISSGVGIMNVMLIMVSERTREIGIKKSVGATRKALFLEVLFESLMLSFGGGATGILIGAGVPYLVRYFLPSAGVTIPVLAVVLGFVSIAMVGLTFGIVPAIRAARLNPAEALRYE